MNYKCAAYHKYSHEYHLISEIERFQHSTMPPCDTSQQTSSFPPKSNHYWDFYSNHLI